jgi:hypothetical protein
MDSSFLEAQANRCRSLAENADQFTKRRLLDLTAKYYARLGRPSSASRTLGIPASLLEADDVWKTRRLDASELNL